MKIKMLSRWIGVLAATALLAGASASQDAGAGDYAVLKDSAGLSSLALREAIDPLFDDSADPALGETRALIVMRRGAIVAERYAPGFGADTKLHGWSIAKTVTGLLVGIMVSDGRLALDDPVPIPAWRQAGDPRAAITLRELMQMRSGLQHREIWQPADRSDALDMVIGKGARDQAAFAASKPLVHPAGSRFNYSSATSTILTGMIAEQLAPGAAAPARREAMARFLAARFSGPLGLDGFTPEYDARGTLIGGAMMHMTARDYARIGELIRLRGKADGRQMISDKWFDFMLAPSPANAAYGGHVWLNRASEQSELFPQDAPARIVGAVGDRGQYVLVSPAQQLVIVRLGVTREADMPALRQALARLIRRFPG